MPEGDTLHRAARRLQVLVGERLEVESPHPRAQAERRRRAVDGRRLESVEAVGKNLVLRFEGGVVVRSHLRMSGRWAVRPRGEARAAGRGSCCAGASARRVLWNGPVLELHTRALAPARAGHPRRRRPTSTRCSRGCARADADAHLGETLQDQRLVAGIGNMWMAETLWRARLSPWRGCGRAGGRAPAAPRDRGASMRASVDAGREPRQAGPPPRRPAVLALRDADPLARPGRCQPHRLLVPAAAR